jgi:1-deoxy-D-xylulose 5-phosphate reductoisomerase
MSVFTAIESKTVHCHADNAPWLWQVKLITQKEQNSENLIQLTVSTVPFFMFDGTDIHTVEKIYLTSSRWSFYKKSVIELEDVTPDEAINTS